MVLNFTDYVLIEDLANIVTEYVNPCDVKFSDCTEHDWTFEYDSTVTIRRYDNRLSVYAFSCRDCGYKSKPMFPPL